MTSHLEIEDLKVGLQTLERRIEAASVGNPLLLEELKMRGARARLRSLSIGQGVQLVAGCIGVLIFGRFWVAHRSQLDLLVCGLLLHGYSLMILAFAVVDLSHVRRIDYSTNVLGLQRQLTHLRAWHLRRAVWTTATGCLMWVPLLIVIFSTWGVDIWVLRPTLVYWNIAASLICLAVCYTLVLCSKRPGWGRLSEYLQQSAVGRSLTSAQAALQSVEEFESN
jgi:hypothetical protein